MSALSFKAQVRLNQMPGLMAKIMGASKMTMEQVVMQSGRLLTRQLMDLTPPTAQTKGASLPQIRKIGETRVEKDIRKIFTQSSDIKFDEKGLARLWRQGDVALVQKILGPGNFLEKYKIVSEPTSALHSAQRTARGRALKRPQKYLVTNRGALKRYITRRKKAVGYMRAGWMNAYFGFGGTGAPVWVARQPRQGGFQQTSVMPYDLKFTFSNATRTIGGANRSMGIVEEALRMRLEDMQANYEKQLSINMGTYKIRTRNR